jgi:hypothetical protein
VLDSTPPEDVRTIPAVERGVVTVPVKVGLAAGAAPIELYEMLLAVEPSKVESAAAPVPSFLKVRALMVPVVTTSHEEPL